MRTGSRGLRQQVRRLPNLPRPSKANVSPLIILITHPRKLEYKYDTKVSKRLSVVLRHDKGEFNLHFFNNATAEVDAILDLPIMREVGARQDTLISCVYYNSKQRFRLLWLHDSSRSGPTLVLGAVQGHSKAVDYDSVHERVDPSRVPVLIHGTHYDFYKKIFKEGLLPGAGNKEWRDQIHLLAASTDLNSKLLPPKCDIVLHIDPALATGCRFYKSANGYYLTGEPIGPQAISAVTIRETKERVEAGERRLPSFAVYSFAGLAAKSARRPPPDGQCTVFGVFAPPSIHGLVAACWVRLLFYLKSPNLVAATPVAGAEAPLVLTATKGWSRRPADQPDQVPRSRTSTEFPGTCPCTCIPTGPGDFTTSPTRLGAWC